MSSGYIRGYCILKLPSVEVGEKMDPHPWLPDLLVPGCLQFCQNVIFAQAVKDDNVKAVQRGNDDELVRESSPNDHVMTIFQVGESFQFSQIIEDFTWNT